MSWKSLLKLVVPAVLAVSVAAPAVQAADLGGRPGSYKDEPDYGPPRYLWTGLYTGLQAGYGWGTSRQTDINGLTTGDYDTDGFIGGGTLGYNFQRGQIVWGVETDISYSDISGVGFSGGAAYTSSIDWLWTVRARVGLDMNGWMPYITGGLAVADVEATSIDGLFGKSETKAGWTIGGGLEVKLDRNWSFKAEYLYVDLGNVGVATPAPIRADFDETHIVRGGINYKF